MGKDVTLEQSPTHDHGREVIGTPAGDGLGHQGEPLFKRFAVSKEWRTKDGATG